MEENDKYKLTFTGDNLIGRAICRTEDGPKYKLTDETTNLLGRTLYRIEALKDFGDVKEGDKGGYVENHSNLSQYGNCWIYDTAKVYSTGYVWGNARICDNAHVYDGASVYDDAIVSGNVYVYDHARICGDAKISELQDYMVFKNWWSDGNLFTWTRSNNMWRTSFFYGKGDELIKNVYQDDEESAREYERVVKYVEDVLKDETKKYKLTDETINLRGITLYRIEALKDFCNVKRGDKGGFVQCKRNLSQEGLCWVYDDACVYGLASVKGNATVCNKACVYGNSVVYEDACVYGNAQVYGDALVYGNSHVYGETLVCGYARVYDESVIYDNAWVSGDALVCEDAEVCGNACICGNAIITELSDYMVFKNWWSSGRYFTWTRSNNMWSVGCFYGTGEELIKKAYQDSKKSGLEYERIVHYVEDVLKSENDGNKESKN